MIKKYFLPTLLIGTWLLGVGPVNAATAKIFIAQPTSPLSVGQTSLLKVMLDTGGQEINAADGTLNFSQTKAITALTTGGSIFHLWPRKPSLVGNKISFTGGTTAGIYGTALKLFTIAIKPTTTKPIQINFENLTLYLADGRGTKLKATGQPLSLAVTTTKSQTNELAELITTDTAAPTPPVINLGQDSSLADGKYFISFYSTDDGSGINRYEVKENDYPLVRASSPYVLQNQHPGGAITVRAIDNAGNVRTQTLTLGQASWWSTVLLSGVGVLLLLILWWWFKPRS